MREGAVISKQVDGVAYLLTRVGDSYYAIENRCAHLGWSLARGQVAEGTIRCPWHGSRYDIRTGKNLDWVNAFAGVPMPSWSHKMIALGKAPAPIKTHALRVEGAELFLP